MAVCFARMRLEHADLCARFSTNWFFFSLPVWYLHSFASLLVELNDVFIKHKHQIEEGNGENPLCLLLEAKSGTRKPHNMEVIKKKMNHIYTYTHNEEIRIAKIWSKNTNGLSITNTIHYTPQLTALALFYSAIINAIYRLTESMLCLTTVAGTERFSLVVALTQHYVCFFIDCF